MEEEVSPELILLDDAYQHRKVKAGYSILLTAYGDLYVDDYYIPSGRLRDHKTRQDVPIPLLLPNVRQL